MHIAQKIKRDIVSVLEKEKRKELKRVVTNINHLRHRKEALIDEILKLEKEAYDEIAIQNHRKQLSNKINSSNF